MSVFRFIKWIDRQEKIQIFGDGKQSRDFTFVDDIADGTICATKMLGYEIINSGGGQQPHSLLDVIAMLEELLGKKAEIEFHPMHPADLKETWADISKANRLLEWRPTISLADGLEQSVRWYRDNLPWSRAIKI